MKALPGKVNKLVRLDLVREGVIDILISVIDSSY